MKLKLNYVVLKPNKKDRAQILPLGDFHLGYPTVNEEKLKGYIDFCIKRPVYVIGMGDYLECGITGAIGDSLYRQKLKPQEQMEYAIELLMPLAKKGLLLGLHSGNHEQRIFKTTGIDITRIMCRILGVRHLGYAMFHQFRVLNQNYTTFSCHGSSGARLPYTKVKAVIDLARHISAQIICMGHVHETYCQKFTYFAVDTTHRRKIQNDKFAILTGHFLEYEGSYAEEKNMIPSKVGAVKISLFGNKHDIHTSQ